MILSERLPDVVSDEPSGPTKTQGADRTTHRLNQAEIYATRLPAACLPDLHDCNEVRCTETLTAFFLAPCEYGSEIPTGLSPLALPTVNTK